MRGGSRYGAGRPGWRGRCEHRNRLDIRQIARKGLLKPYSAFSWRWSRDGEPAGSVSVSIDAGACWLTLAYSRTIDSETKSYSDTFRVEYTPCTYGGQRPWLVCRWCQRRCAIIYGLSSDGHFACRRCMRLGYVSESLSPVDRAQRKVQRLEDLLTEDGGKPSRMHERTFQRILDKWEKASERYDDLWSVRMDHLLATLEAFESAAKHSR